MSSDAEPPRAGRKRSEAARGAILDAALTLLQERGYAALTTDAIAERAGTGKQTIYRWWPSKADVVLEALMLQGQSIRAPATGDLEQDLAAFLRATFRLVRGPAGTGAALKALMAQAQLDPAFQARFQAFIATRRDALRAVLAVQPWPAAGLEAAVDMLFGAMWYRLLVEHAPLDAPFARELARIAVHGVLSSRKPG